VQIGGNAGTNGEVQSETDFVCFLGFVLRNFQSSVVGHNIYSMSSSMLNVWDFSAPAWHDFSVPDVPMPDDGYFSASHLCANMRSVLSRI
jgi:hypothetical protein